MAQTDAPAPAAAPSFGASLADPGPLGLAGFAMTTFFLSSANAGILSGTVEGVVLGLALFYGGIAQLLAGMWEFAKGNTFGAVAFSSYGAFWLSFWYLVAHTDLSGASADDINKGVGWYLLGWTIFTAYMLIGTFRLNGMLIAVFGVLTLTFLLLTLGKFAGQAGGSGMTGIGGWTGILTALLAWYGSMAGILNSTFKKVVLPVFPRCPDDPPGDGSRGRGVRRAPPRPSALSGDARGHEPPYAASATRRFVAASTSGRALRRPCRRARTGRPERAGSRTARPG